MKKKVATFIKKLENFTGEARLYQLQPPMVDEDGGAVEYVAVSATIAMFSGPETYIFPADAKGKVKNWGELTGSYRGGLDFEEALSGAGYSIKA